MGEIDELRPRCIRYFAKGDERPLIDLNERRPDPVTAAEIRNS
jgi:hypothetical protein